MMTAEANARRMRPFLKLRARRPKLIARGGLRMPTSSRARDPAALGQSAGFPGRRQRVGRPYVGEALRVRRAARGRSGIEHGVLDSLDRLQRVRAWRPTAGQGAERAARPTGWKEGLEAVGPGSG